LRCRVLPAVPGRCKLVLTRPGTRRAPQGEKLLRRPQGCIQYWHEKEGAAKVLGVPADAALAVRIAAKPFVDWLAEASDEEEDEDSDEE
jgi:eIF4-gamma/eIF5/eIF2-epsilon